VAREEVGMTEGAVRVVLLRSRILRVLRVGEIMTVPLVVDALLCDAAATKVLKVFPEGIGACRFSPDVTVFGHLCGLRLLGKVERSEDGQWWWAA
jgi:hypothetical protein